MHSDELSALADALDRLKFRCDGIDDACLVEDAADYLRACADAQPVAWVQSNHLDEARRSVFMARLAPKQIDQGYVPLYAHPAPAAHAGWKWVPVEPTPEMLSAVGMMDGYDWHAPGCSPDADHANWYSAMIDAAPTAPQAEPKREPLTYEQLVSACYTYRHDFGLLDPDEQELVIEEAGRWAKAFGIGGSDAE